MGHKASTSQPASPTPLAEPAQAGALGDPALAHDELSEFLEADTLGADADPAFRERLRQRVLRWLEAGRSSRGPDAD